MNFPGRKVFRTLNFKTCISRLFRKKPLSVYLKFFFDFTTTYLPTYPLLTSTFVRAVFEKDNSLMVCNAQPFLNYKIMVTTIEYIEVRMI